MFDWLSNPDAWLALITLTILEIILGIDNIIFLSIVVLKLPQHQQNMARRVGLLGAMLMRLALLASITLIMKLTFTLFTIDALNLDVSIHDLILFFGGLFLVYKGIREIREFFVPHEVKQNTKQLTFFSAIAQVMLLDIVFSLDSVITAVGLSGHFFIMAAAIVIAIALMLFAAKSISDFVETYPSVKMLALAFLVMVGLVLMIEAFHVHVPKAYVYFAMFFSLSVTILDILRTKHDEKALNNHK